MYTFYGNYFMYLYVYIVMCNYFMLNFMRKFMLKERKKIYVYIC